MRRRLFAPGTVVFREGDASHEAYLLRTGRVEVVKETPAGPLRLAVLGAGDVLGEMGLLDERPRSASALALEAVEADAVNAAEFAELLATEPARSMGILRAMFERLRTVNERLSAATPVPAEARSLPVVRLFPVTDETRRALPEDGLEITRFPFRVGRASRERDAELLHFNELELPDTPPYVLSSNHFALDLGADGLVVRDRGSLHGTAVNGVRIGSKGALDVAPLRPGENEVVAGPTQARAALRESPFRFRIVLG